MGITYNTSSSKIFVIQDDEDHADVALHINHHPPQVSWQSKLTLAIRMMRPGVPEAKIGEPSV